MNKKIIKEMQIMTYLESIKESTNVAYGYIKGKYRVNDIGELITALSCIPDDINEIKQLIFDLIKEYEKEIMETEYE